MEEVWKAIPSHESARTHIQGLVQLAVAFHHQSMGNRDGARSVLERAMRNLEAAEASLPELDLPFLRTSLEAWRQYLGTSQDLTKDSPRPALPKLRFLRRAPSSAC